MPPWCDDVGRNHAIPQALRSVRVAAPGSRRSSFDLRQMLACFRRIFVDFFAFLCEIVSCSHVVLRRALGVT